MSVFTFSDLAFMGAVGGVAAFDPDAQVYITAVETADGQALEAAVRTAINDFVVGCKADGIWAAIKASCILAGARTLAGALQPLVGTAPTRFGTEGEWNYNRKTGLQGNGTNNYLDSNRNNNADPQNSKHLAAGITNLGLGGRFMGTDSPLGATGESKLVRYGGGEGAAYVNGRDGSFGSLSLGFLGGNRNSASSFSVRHSGTTATFSGLSEVPENGNIYVFRSAAKITSCRLSFYSIGESLDLALLDARVTALINKFAEVIP